jgi:ATP-dependent Clp protease protease subunit
MSKLPLPKARTLFLVTQVDQESISYLTESIIDINKSDAELSSIYNIYGLKYEPLPIELYIDSYGGNVYQCLGLLSIMETSRTPIHTYVTGCAMSAAFFISITGHKRYGYTKSTWMYHQIWGDIVSASVKQIDEEFTEFKRLQDLLEDHVVEYTKIPKTKLTDIFKSKYDYYIDSTQAIKWKIVDEVVTNETR